MTRIVHEPPPRVAMMGLGTMGGGMARRLLDAGFPLTVYNRTPAKGAALVADGARMAASPRDAAAGAAIVIGMVADDDASRATWLGERGDGALFGATPGTVLIEAGTLTVEWIRELALAAQQRGCELLDAPVTGSKSHAAAGELTFLVGGSARALDVARPALAVMSRAIMHVGPTGSGALLKLVNNFVCGVQAAALAEALTLIEQGGLERELSVGVLTNGAPGSPLVKALSQRMMESAYAPHFHLSLMAKDLTYAAREGDARHVSLSMAAPALAAFTRAAEAGLGGEDFSAVIEPMRTAARRAGDLAESAHLTARHS